LEKDERMYGERGGEEEEGEESSLLGRRGKKG